jgi:hypothetical protein
VRVRAVADPMTSGGRVVRAGLWVAAAGLLALVVSTNCGPVAVTAIIACAAGGGGGGGSNDPKCELGSTCDSGSGLCTPITCNDGDLSVCPIGTTCAPDKGPGVCKPPEQFTCDAGQVCSPFPVRAAGGTTEACGCIPR